MSRLLEELLRRDLPVFLVMSLAFLCTAAPAVGPRSPDGATSPSGLGAPARATAGTALAPGLRAYQDPETGRLASPPEEEMRELSGDLTDRFSAYGDDLLEERTEAGGYRVDLRGRFRSAVVARRGADGALTTECLDAAVTVAGAEEVHHER